MVHGKRLSERTPIQAGTYSEYYCIQYRFSHSYLASFPFLLSDWMTSNNGLTLRRSRQQNTKRNSKCVSCSVGVPANANAHLQELKTRIEALTQRHQLTNVARLGRAAALQTQT